jgi:hypothetical protein
MGSDPVVQLEEAICKLKSSLTQEVWEYVRDLAIDVERRIEALQKAHQELAGDPDEAEVVERIEARIAELEKGLSRMLRAVTSSATPTAA